MADIMQKIAAQYALKYQNSREGAFASGFIGRYPVTMKKTSSPQTLRVDLWATCENAEEEPALTGFLNSLASAGDGAITSAGWSGDNTDRFGAVSLAFRNPKEEEESTELFLMNTLGRLRTFLEEHHFAAKCGLCAGTENVGVYLVDGLYGVSHCQACNENWRREVKEAAGAMRLSSAEWVKGIWGSFFGAFFGAILWVLAYRATDNILLVVICSGIIALGSVRSFKKFAKKQNSASFRVSVFMFIFALLVAQLHCLTLDLRVAWSGEYPGITYLQVVSVIPYLLYDSPDARNQVLGNLIPCMLAGGFVLFSLSRKTSSCTELVSPERKRRITS